MSKIKLPSQYYAVQLAKKGNGEFASTYWVTVAYNLSSDEADRKLKQYQQIESGATYRIKLQTHKYDKA